MRRLNRLRREEGMIMPLAMIVLVGLLALVALVVNSSITASDQASVQINRRVALAAADSGLQAGIYRLSAQPWAQQLGNSYAINPTHCFGTKDDNVPSGNGTCGGPENGNGQDGVTDSLGSQGSYTYNITPALSQTGGPSCTGWWVSGGSSYGGVTQRCITASGTYHGVTRRVQERIAAESWVFPINGILSLGEMNWDTSGSQTLTLPGTFESVGQMTIGKVGGSTQTIPDDLSGATLISNIPIAFGSGNKCNAPCVYQDPTNTTPPPNVTRPPGPDASVYAWVASHPCTSPPTVTPCNNNAALPSSVYSSTTHVFSSSAGTPARPPTQGSIGYTIPAGTYIFCGMTVGGVTAIPLNSQVTIYIDSITSGDGYCGTKSSTPCSQTPGTLTMNRTGLYNPNANPGTLSIFIYGNPGCTLAKGSRGQISIDNSGNLLDSSGNTSLTNANLYAPDTYLTTTGVGIYWSGGIVVGGAESNDNDIWGFAQHPPTQQWFPTAWHECSAKASDPTDPGSGCY